jgi:hypothetical protein
MQVRSCARVDASPTMPTTRADTVGMSLLYALGKSASSSASSYGVARALAQECALACWTECLASPPPPGMATELACIDGCFPRCLADDDAAATARVRADEWSTASFVFCLLVAVALLGSIVVPRSVVQRTWFAVTSLSRRSKVHE